MDRCSSQKFKETQKPLHERFLNYEKFSVENGNNHADYVLSEAFKAKMTRCFWYILRLYTATILLCQIDEN